MLKKLFFLIAVFLLTISSCVLGVKYLTSENRKTPFLKQTQSPIQAVLAAATEAPHFIFKVNVPSFFNENTEFAKDVDIKGGLTVQGNAVFKSGINLNNNNLDLGTGTITASNILYGLKAGNGVTITSGQTPTIATTNTGVTSFQSQTGDLTLTAGSGISIDGLKISATSTNTTQNIFKTISDGTNSFSAGSNSDTLTLTAGTGITITTDTNNKKLTFGATSPFSGLTTNGIIYATSDTTITSLTPGTSGYVLQSNGTGTTPSWVSASSVGTNYWQLNSGVLSPATISNKLSLGTTNSLATLDIHNLNSTQATASFSGKTSFAALTVDNSGVGDIFAASSSGLSRFVITQNGNIGIGTNAPSAALDITNGSSATGPSNFANSVPITINNTSNSNTLTNYQVKITLNTASLISAGKMQSSCNDIRVTDNDKTTLLSYWLEGSCNSTSTVIWTKVPSIPASSNYTIYLFYNNAGASNLSSASNTFVRDIPNLQAHWSMEEASGSTVNDASGNGDNGTATGTTIVSGKFTNARQFSSSSDYITVDTNHQTGIPYGASARSVCGWAKLNSSVGAYSFFFGTGADSTLNAFSLGAYSTSAELGAWNSDLQSANFWSSTGVWHFLCATYDGTTATIYGDGASLASAAKSYNTSSGNNIYFGIGQQLYNGAWPGTVEQLTVYSRALTTAEISDLYNNYGYATTNYTNHELVRKFSSPDPNTSTGSEQTGAASHVIYADAFSSGDVGIGTANPSSFKLQVAGSIGPDATDAYNLGSSSLEWNSLYAKNIFTSGNVGIGTSTATSLLDVKYTSANTSAATPALILDNPSTSGNAITSLDLKTNGTTMGRFYVDGAGDSFLNGGGGGMYLNWNSLTSTPGTLQIGGQTVMGPLSNNLTPLATLDLRSINGTQSIASISGKTSFATLTVDNSGVGDLFTASSSGLSRFVITQNGNVGIGTTTPSQKLAITNTTSGTNINNGDADTLRLINGNGSQNTGAAIDFQTGNPGGAVSRIAGVNLGNWGSGLAFYTHPSNGTNEDTSTERMRIDQNGNIGIGTTSTSTNLLNITGSANDLVAINSSLNTSFNRAFEVLDSSLGTTNNLLMDVGHDLSTNDAGYLGFNYQGSGSTSNFITLGFYGNDNLFNFTAKGNLGIGTSNPAGTLDLVQQTQTSGSPNVLKLTGASNTTLTAATDNDVLFNLARTVQFTGSSSNGAANFTNQNAVQINAPTYAFSSTGSQTITNARTMYINNGPIAGASNTTLTNSYGLQIDNANGLANGGTVTNAYGLEVNEATGATHNYAAYFNGATTIGNNATPNAKEILHVEQYNQTSGSPKIIGVAANSYSGITAATNPDILFDLSHSVGFAGSSTPGAANFTNQYAFQINAPSYNFNNTGAQTITNAVSQYINGAPAAGTGTGAITLTNSIGLLIDNSNGLDGGGTVTNAYGLYVKQQQTASTHSYAAYFGAPVVIGNNKTPYVHDALYVMQDPETVNSAQILHLASNAYSTIPAGDNPDVVFDLSHSVQFGGAAGSGVDNIASSSAFEINAPTYSFSGSGTQTITSAATQYINNPVIAGGGSSITITNDYGLLIDAANSVGGGGTVTNSYGLRVNTSSGATNNYAAIFNGGNVGIGDTAPGNTLKVVGSLCVKNAATACAGTTSGNIYATNTTVQAADVAENYVSSQTLEPGDIIMPAADGDNQAVVKTTSTYQAKTIGVVSTKPGVTLNSDAQTDSAHPNLYPIALQGRVPVKVATSNGQIHTGDLLTTSSIPGVAMKAATEGQIIGKALEDYTNPNTTEVGKIMVFINISWSNPNFQIAVTDNGNISLNGQPVNTQTATTEPQMTNLASNENTDQFTQLQNQIATLSAQLGKVNDLSQNLTELEKTINIDQSLQSSGTQSAIFNLATEDQTIEGNLTVSGRTILSDIGITGQITDGLLAINGMDTASGTPSATINTLSAPLKLQSLAINGIDFENGKVTIDTNGNITTTGNITAGTISANKLNLKDTGNNPAIGEATLPNGETKIEVDTTAVTENSKVFVTAETMTRLPLIVTQKKPNKSFTVEIAEPQDRDLKFSWWISN